MNEPKVPPLLASREGQGELTTEAGTMRWYRSPNGVWCVCAQDDDAPACACGLTVEGAIRQWERARATGE